MSEHATGIRPLTSLTARAVVLRDEDIDTDQIIPARFLTTTSRDGLGRHCFNDWRYDAAGNPRPGSILNDPRMAETQVIIGGRNFGCGSSREHAPWALAEMGIRCVVSSAIADIFSGNALKNGLLPAVVPEDFAARLLELEWPTVTIDVAARTVTVDGVGTASFGLDAFSQECLLKGYDQLDYLVERVPQAEAFEARRREAGVPA